MPTRDTFSALWRILHATAILLLGLAVLAMLAATALAALGNLPWLSLQAGWGGVAAPQAGPVAQVGLTVLLLLVLAILPSSGRVLALERSHRDFRMSMTDVAQAYHHAHAADRKGIFTLSSEFDQVRERIEYLRDHPDLRLLEADVLTLAAQMSQQSHRLAEVYSDERVARARDFLRQRQKEAEDQQKLIAEALVACREIGRWAGQVELEEAMVASQLSQLDEQLQAVLPQLGYSFDGQAAEPAPEPVAASHGAEVRRPANVVPLALKPAAE